MHPKLKYQPITPITNASVNIPPSTIGFIVEIYHDGGSNGLGKISYDNSSRSIVFNKNKTGGIGFEYNPKYTQQIFLTKDQNNLFPTKLTTYSNGGYVSIKGWLVLEEISKKPDQFTIKPNIKTSSIDGKYSLFNINETLIFSCYSSYISVPVTEIISGNDRFSILTLNSYSYHDGPMVFYLSTDKGLLVGKTIFVTNKKENFLYLICRSHIDVPFIDNDILLPITTFHCEATTEVNITIDQSLSKSSDICDAIYEHSNLFKLLEGVDIRLTNFITSQKRGNHIVS